MSENTAFPMAPSPFTGESREVEPGACFDWLRQGWAMFLGNPVAWIGSALPTLFLLPSLFFGALPVQFAIFVLMPLYGAGVFQQCRRQANDEKYQLADLFAGFRSSFVPLVTVGLICATGIFGIPYLAVLAVQAGFMGSGVSGRVAGIGIVIGAVMLATLLVFILSVPVIMASWFAPVLVFFHGMKPIDAMKASFAAGCKNWLAMLVFGLILTIVSFFAILPFILGLLLLLPVISAAVYASYRDIFEGV